MKGASCILTVTVLLIVPVMGLLPSSVSGETYVGGHITGTWTAVNGPYIVTSNIVVPVNETLIIEPGVVVKFQDDMSMFVEGALVAVGTPAEPILFTSNSSSPNWMSWWNIQFNETSDEAVSRIGHARIEYAFHAIILEDTSIPVENVTFYRNGFGVTIVSSSSVVRNNIFLDKAHSAVNCQHGCQVTVSDNTMKGYINYGVFVVNASAHITRNLIECNNIGIILHDAIADIHSNQIRSCLMAIKATESTVNVSDQDLDYNDIGIWLGSSTLYARELSMEFGHYGMYLSSSTVRMEDSSVHGGLFSNIRALGSTQGELWNSSVDSSSTDLWLGDESIFDLYGTDFEGALLEDNATLRVHWYLDLRVEDNHGDPVSGASVNVSDSEGTFEVQLETDEAGGAEQLLLPEYERNRSSTVSYSPYRVLSQKWNHEDNETFVDLDRNKLVVLEQRVLNEPPVVGLDYPLAGMWFGVGYPMQINWVASDDHTPIEDLEFYIIYTCDGCDGGSVAGPLIGASAYNWTVPEVLKGHNVSISIIAVDEGGFSAVDRSGWVVIGEVTPLPSPIDGMWLILVIILGILFWALLSAVILFILGKRRRGGETEQETHSAETESRP